MDEWYTIDIDPANAYLAIHGYLPKLISVRVIGEQFKEAKIIGYNTECRAFCTNDPELMYLPIDKWQLV